MRPRHVAFMVESAHGHLNPILGMVAELVRRGHRVTCAVKDYFAARVVESGAEALIYEPLDYRVAFIPKWQETGRKDSLRTELWRQFEREEMDHAMPQLLRLYQDDRPDLIVYDLRNLAGRALAVRWNIPKLEHAPVVIESNERNQLGGPYDENLVIASIPRFFQLNADELDERFHFVGTSFTDRRFFEPWKSDASTEPMVLVSPTTAMAQPEFLLKMIRALENLPYRVVLSIGNQIEPDSLGRLPARFRINLHSSQMEILRQSSLYIGQGGQGSLLEALYCGVPALLIPPADLWDQIAQRVVKLGVGIRLEPSASTEEIRRAVAFLILDSETHRRVKEAQLMIQDSGGAKAAADLIDEYIGRHGSSLTSSRNGLMY